MLHEILQYVAVGVFVVDFLGYVLWFGIKVFGIFNLFFKLFSLLSVKIFVVNAFTQEFCSYFGNLETGKIR